jgi:hypothetical protein
MADLDRVADQIEFLVADAGEFERKSHALDATAFSGIVGSPGPNDQMKPHQMELDKERTAIGKLLRSAGIVVMIVSFHRMLNPLKTAGLNFHGSGFT